jgi:hypothetical protein
MSMMTRSASARATKPAARLRSLLVQVCHPFPSMRSSSFLAEHRGGADDGGARHVVRRWNQFHNTPELSAVASPLSLERERDAAL